MKNNWIILGLISLILVSIVSFSVGAEPEAKQESEAELVEINSDNARLERQTNLYIWTENVIMEYKETTINSERLEIDRDENIAYFSEQVALNRSRPETDEPQQIWSRELEFDLATEILIAREEVELTSTKHGKPLNLTSEYLKLWTESDDMVAENEVVVDYDGQMMRGEHMEYTADEDKMVMTEEVEIREDGEWLKSERATLWLEDDVLEAEGQVEMEFEI